MAKFYGIGTGPGDSSLVTVKAVNTFKILDILYTPEPKKGADSLALSIVKKYFGGFENYTLLSSVVTELTFIFATFIIFLFLYKFMPKNKMTFKSQIPGAIFGAISLNVVSFIFAKYLDIFKGFSITYGSLTTLMLIMMWTYSCFYTLFLGAEINKSIQINKTKKE